MWYYFQILFLNYHKFELIGLTFARLCGNILKVWWKVLYGFLLEIYLSFQQWKNFENLLRIDKVIAMSLVYYFFGIQCTMSQWHQSSPLQILKSWRSSGAWEQHSWVSVQQQLSYDVVFTGRAADRPHIHNLGIHIVQLAYIKATHHTLRPSIVASRVYFRPLKKGVALPLAIVKKGYSYLLNI